MNTKSSFRPTRKPAKKFETFTHSSELNPKALKAQAAVKTLDNHTIEVSDLSDKDLIAEALVQLVAWYVPAIITVEQALSMIHDVFSVYKPARGHEHDEADRGLYADHLYCRLTLDELVDLVATTVPDIITLLPRSIGGGWMPAW